MSRERDPFGLPRGNGAPERRLALSGLIHRTLISVTERERQRGHLIDVLILALALLTLALLPARWGTPATFALASALAVYLMAFLANRVFSRPGAAAYILVFGGSIAVFAQALVPAIAGNPPDTAQAALFFVAVILAAGLLFAPEVTLIAAAACMMLAAFALLLALAVANTIDRTEAYLLIIYTLGLQALAGLIAWLLAQYILDSALEAQKSQEIQFSQARLEALSKKIADDQERLDEEIGLLQTAITRAIAGDYNVRAELPDSELSTLAETLNVLLERVGAATQAEQAQSRMQAAALPIIDAISRMGDATAVGSVSPPMLTNTPIDSVSLVIGKMRENVAKRLDRVQHIVVETAGVLSNTEGPLHIATEEVHEAQRIAGALRATAEAISASANRQLALIAQVRRELAALLPEDITRTPANQKLAGASGAERSASLLGLGLDLGLANPGHTGEFTALISSEPGETPPGFAPLTIPLPAIDARALEQVEHVASEQALASGAGTGAGMGQQPPAQLVEAWSLIASADGELAQIERSGGQISRELGVQTRHMRQVDANIAWFRQAVETVQSNAEQLQQIASAGLAAPGDAAPISRPLTPEERISGPQWPVPPSPPDTPSTLEELASRAMPQTSGEHEQGHEHEGPPTGSLRAADLVDVGNNPFAPPTDRAANERRDM